MLQEFRRIYETALVDSAALFVAAFGWVEFRLLPALIRLSHFGQVVLLSVEFWCVLGLAFWLFGCAGA
jgi:hypothetical protein